MKIVFLSRLYWPHVGGVERHIWHLSQELLKMKHEVVVITEQHDESLPLEREGGWSCNISHPLLCAFIKDEDLELDVAT